RDCYFFISYHSFFFFSSRRRHTRSTRDWSSDVCSSDLGNGFGRLQRPPTHEDRQPGEEPSLDVVQEVVAPGDGVAQGALALGERSEERRVGKECSSRWGREQ